MIQIKLKNCVIELFNLYPLALKFVPDWFVTNNIIEKIDSAVFPDDYIVYGDLDSDFVAFFITDISLNSNNLNINLDDENFACCDTETISHVRLIGRYNKFK